ncbi:MAG: hypothetical protein K8L99_14820 [Anaerolineae bacterium]|nr:hypothetical protein [Anaerolineae bacterium]
MSFKLLGSVVLAAILLTVMFTPAHAQPIPDIDQPLAEIHTDKHIYKLDWHPDGSVLAAASDNGLTLYDDSLHTITQRYPGERIYSLSWHPDGTQLVVTHGDNLDIWQWDGVQLTPLTTLEGDNPQINVLWSPDGTRLASVDGSYIRLAASWDATIRFWDTTTWTLTATADGIYQFAQSLPTVNQIAWEPNGAPELLVVGNTIFLQNGEYLIETTSRIRFIDANTGARTRVIPLTVDNLTTAVAWSPSGDQIAVNNSVDMSFYDAVTGNNITAAYTFAQATSISWSPDGRYVIGYTRVYDTVEKKHVFSYANPPLAWVTVVTWHPDGSQIAIGYTEGTIRIEDATLLPGFEMPPTDRADIDQTIGDGDRGSSATIRDIDWSPDGTKIAVGDNTGLVHILEASTGQVLSSVQFGDAIRALAWHPTNNALLAVSSLTRNNYNATVFILNVITGQTVLTIATTAEDIIPLDWSPDGTRLVGATGFIANTVASRDMLVWDTSSGQIVIEASLGRNSVIALAWSPDGNLIASAGIDNMITLWDADTLTVVTELAKDIGLIRSIDWNPDSTQLASAIFFPDKVIYIWDISTGQADLIIPDVGVSEIAWSPDGTKLAVEVSEAEMPIFDPATGEILMVIDQGTTALAIAWSPDGQQLAFGSYVDDITIVRLPTAPEVSPEAEHR